MPRPTPSTWTPFSSGPIPIFQWVTISQTPRTTKWKRPWTWPNWYACAGRPWKKASRYGPNFSSKIPTASPAPWWAVKFQDGTAKKDCRKTPSISPSSALPDRASAPSSPGASPSPWKGMPTTTQGKAFPAAKSSSIRPGKPPSKQKTM